MTLLRPLASCLFTLVLLIGGTGCAAGPDEPVAGPDIPPADARILWFDATANFERLGTYEGIDRVLSLTDSVGFTDIIIDVKPVSGEVLYDSEIAPELRTYQDFTRPDSFDFVGYLVREGRARGLRVHLAMNVFSEGHKYTKTGPIYTSHPEWQTVVYDEDGALRPTTEVDRGYSAFVNPAREDVRAYELSIARELTERFRPDGIILDRGRYDNLYSDFSPETRALFEAHIGRKVENWPDDIMRRTDDPGKPEQGPLFKQWLEWRASVIHSFFREARATVKDVDPSILFGTYVGAWYPIYYEVGVNWAPSTYDPSQDYDWALPTYKEQGYAEMLDLLMTGNYFVEVTPEDLRRAKEEATRVENGMNQDRDTSYTVESSIRLVDRIVGDAVRVLPSLYVEQYALAGKPEEFEKALDATMRMKNGIMVFDLVHLDRDNLWDVVARAFEKYPRTSR